VFKKGIISIFYFSFFITLTLLFIFLGYVFYKGFANFSLNIIFDEANPIRAIIGKERVFDGIFNAIVGSVLVSSLATLLALPFGFLSGVYIASFAPRRIKSLLSFSYELLASIPSIVIGLFGLSITIYLHKNFFGNLYTSLLISALSLAVLILPYIVKMSEQAISNIPNQIKNSALNLGATRYENLFLIKLPYISKDLFGGVVLAIGRAVEDTAVIMLTGAVAMAGIPNSLLSKYEAIPFFIYYISSEYQDMFELNKGYVAAMVLLFVSIALFLFAFLIQKLSLRGKFE